VPYELVIVGAGISGLTAAMAAREAGLTGVLLVEHEKNTGGTARLLRGSAEFREETSLLEASAALPYEIWFQATVTGFLQGEAGEGHQLNIQTPTGTRIVEASKVLLCSGSLEKPREARRIAGTRPAGIMTSTMALNLVARGYRPGERILVYDNGRIARAAAQRLVLSDARVERLPGDRWEVLKVGGISRLNRVEAKDRLTGQPGTFDCDTLIYAEQRIPGTFYLKGSLVERDREHAIRVDEQGRTNIENVYAAGACTDRGDDDHASSMASARAVIHSLWKGNG